MIKEFRLHSIFENKEIIELEDLAKFILEHKNEYDQPDSVFAFPKGWTDEPIKLKPTSITIPTNNDSDLDPIYQAYSKTFEDIKQYNLGGLDLMIAAHNTVKNSQHEQRPHSNALRHKEDAYMENHTITVHNPASFNYQLATGTNTLITNVLHRKIRIKKVVVGVDNDWALKDKTK